MGLRSRHGRTHQQPVPGISMEGVARGKRLPAVGRRCQQAEQGTGLRAATIPRIACLACLPVSEQCTRTWVARRQSPAPRRDRRRYYRHNSEGNGNKHRAPQEPSVVQQAKGDPQQYKTQNPTVWLRNGTQISTGQVPPKTESIPQIQASFTIAGSKGGEHTHTQPAADQARETRRNNNNKKQKKRRESQDWLAD